jgi:hypothetical protein
MCAMVLHELLHRHTWSVLHALCSNQTCDTWGMVESKLPTPEQCSAERNGY